VTNLEQAGEAETRAGTPVHTALPYANAAGGPDGAELRARATRFDIAVVALRLLGLFILYEGAVALSWEIAGFADIAGGARTVREVAFGLLPPAVCGAVGVLLLKGAPRIAIAILPQSGNEGSSGGPSAGSVSLQGIAFSLAGVMLMAYAVPKFISLFVGTLRQVNDVYSAPRHGGDFVAVLLEPGLQIAIGAWLFVGSKRLAAYWHRLRHPELAAKRDLA
jgi:hypothetical protein